LSIFKSVPILNQLIMMQVKPFENTIQLFARQLSLYNAFVYCDDGSAAAIADMKKRRIMVVSKHHYNDTVKSTYFRHN